MQVVGALSCVSGFPPTASTQGKQPLRQDLLEGEGQVSGSQSLKARSNLGPRDSILHQNVSKFLVANQVFLGSWIVDICQKGHSQRSVPQRRHTAHLRRCTGCTPRKLSGRDEGGSNSQRPHSPSTWSPELLRPGKGTKRRPSRVCAFVEYPRT